MSPHALLNSNDADALKLTEAAQVSTAGVVSRTVLQAPDLRVVLFTFAEGQELTAHTNRRRALVQIVDGACEFLFADTWRRLEAGTFLHLPPNHPHAVRASFGPFSMLLILGSELPQNPNP